MLGAYGIYLILWYKKVHVEALASGFVASYWSIVFRIGKDDGGHTYSLKGNKWGVGFHNEENKL